MTTSINIHSVKKVEIDNGRLLPCNTYARTLSITNSNDEVTEITIFSKDNSVLTLVPLQEALDTPPRI